MTHEQCVKCNIDKKTFNKDSPSESSSNIQDTLTTAVSTCIPLKKRAVRDATKNLIQARKKNFHKMTPEEQRESSKAIKKSSRDDYRSHINGISRNWSMFSPKYFIGPLNTILFV